MADGQSTPGRARDQLSGLLTQLTGRVPGMTHAALTTGDGLLVAACDACDKDTVDRLAASTTGIYSLGGASFQGLPGGVRQIVIEHDAGCLFVMAAGLAGGAAVGTILVVRTTPEADAGLVGHLMTEFIRGLDEHLVVAARRNDTYSLR
ncbi:roadblock/LC7 domain-containing protein [Streptomyces sp. PTM05]|uniref:Roadblock/LC7 domain-containing protein n=1 Tax=Streptantibioticus parmotrematis TaxID=2873249 RepID=A0ABS7QVM7_9ACTN|nr:roadblock/LC7 domain-containing protein [Streptantibioticus parmotrematis]MBY8887275.1 roadblock/LC7 domain-containing protein [Streptantibioticus parmotrematis]